MIAQLEQLKEANSALIKEVSDKDTTIGSLTRRLDEANIHLEEVAVLKGQVADQSKRMAVMDSELAATAGELRRAHSQQAVLQRTTEGLQRDHTDQREQIRKLQADRDAKHKLIRRLDSHGKRLTGQVDELELQLSSHRVQTTAARDNHRQAVRELDRMRLEIETLKESKHQYLLEKSDNFRQVAMLTKEVPKMQRQKMEAIKDLAKLEAQHRALQEASGQQQERHAAARAEANRDILKLASQIKLIFNLKWTEQRAIVAEAKEVGTLPPAKKGQTRIDAAMKQQISQVKGLVGALEGKVDEVTDSLQRRLEAVEGIVQEVRADNEAHLRRVEELQQHLVQEQACTEPLRTELHILKEEMVIRERSSVQAALATARLERVKEEDDERATAQSLRSRALARSRPVTAPPARTLGRSTKVWGNNPRDSLGYKGGEDFNFWSKVR